MYVTICKVCFQSFLVSTNNVNYETFFRKKSEMTPIDIQISLSFHSSCIFISILLLESTNCSIFIKVLVIALVTILLVDIFYQPSKQFNFSPREKFAKTLPLHNPRNVWIF